MIMNCLSLLEDMSILSTYFEASFLISFLLSLKFLYLLVILDFYFYELKFVGSEVF